MENTQSVLSYSDYLKLDIQNKLAFWIALPQGSMLPSDWPDTNVWHIHIQHVCAEALNEIQFLRRHAGAISQGPSFDDLRRQQRAHQDKL